MSLNFCLEILSSWTWLWVYWTQMASIISQSQSNKAHLGWSGRVGGFIITMNYQKHFVIVFPWSQKLKFRIKEYNSCYFVYLLTLLFFIFYYSINHDQCVNKRGAQSKKEAVHWKVADFKRGVSCKTFIFSLSWLHDTNDFLSKINVLKCPYTQGLWGQKWHIWPFWWKT